ncbi:MAG: hypothetical protein JNK04_24740 [Myxococcales bacterium]|nr:hypothetical protein [Myxococcales bacterium]
MSAPRAQGLVSLVRAAVDGGSRAVERVQLDMAKRTFDILEAVPGVREPAKVVHFVYDISVNSTHGIIRLVNGAVGGALEVAVGYLAQQEGARNNTDAEPPTGSPSE